MITMLNNSAEIDKLEEELKALFRGSQAHDIVPTLCFILRDMEARLTKLEDK